MRPDLLHADLLHDGELLAQLVAVALAAAIVAWHIGGLLVCAAVRRWPQRRGLHRLVRWSPAGVRRLAGIACGASIVLAPIGASAASPTTATAVATDEPFVRTPEVTAPTTSIAAPAPVPPPAPAPAPVPAPAVAPAPVTPVARTHVVEPGDNLWRIARTEIARVTGVVDPSDHAIVPYWHAVIDANRATLRSGDPSLIFPGEIVTLPAA